MTRRYGYADPPYPGQAQRHYAKEAAAAGRVAREVNHPLLVAYLVQEFPDGWALSTSTPALRYVLNLCPEEARVGAWCKPFAVYKPNVKVAYTWEPVIFCGGRPARDRWEDTVRDHLIAPDPPPLDSVPEVESPAVRANITMRRGVAGAKPAVFTRWVLDVLGVQPGDEVVDIFPGSGAFGDEAAAYLSRVPSTPGTLWAEP